jgi:hypothetical protein
MRSFGCNRRGEFEHSLLPKKLHRSCVFKVKEFPLVELMIVLPVSWMDDAALLHLNDAKHLGNKGLINDGGLENFLVQVANLSFKIGVEE